MEPKQTLLDAEEYLRSLNLDRTINKVYGVLDGAALYRAADEHFVIVVCTEHDNHQGHALLRRVLPAAWDVLYKGANTEEAFEAWHYGPADTELATA